MRLIFKILGIWTLSSFATGALWSAWFRTQQQREVSHFFHAFQRNQENVEYAVGLWVCETCGEGARVNSEALPPGSPIAFAGSCQCGRQFELIPD